MVSIATKRSVMICFSEPTAIDGHRVRFVLAEKGIQHEIELIDAANPPEELLALNPYFSLPTLLDRDLVLYDPQVIIEYLDERFPHPPLMPVDPVSRAHARLTVQRIISDLYCFIPELEDSSDRKASKARKGLRDVLTSSVELFTLKRFFLQDEFSVMDATIAPLLWRLPSYGVELPPQARPIEEYAARIFSRPGFQASLTEDERELRG
jgi:RNA polymerase-associated protein